MHFLFFFPLLWWQVNLGHHKYPAGIQLAYVQQAEARGASVTEAKCQLKEIEDTWTFNQALLQWEYFLTHEKLTDEAWKIYINCKS